MTTTEEPRSRADQRAADKTDPGHYKGFSNGAIPWDIAERLNYNRGTALVYIARAGRKPGESALDDLQKARNYLDREIDRIITDGKETAEKTLRSATVPVEPIFLGYVNERGETIDPRTDSRSIRRADGTPVQDGDVFTFGKGWTEPTVDTVTPIVESCFQPCGYCDSADKDPRRAPRSRAELGSEDTDAVWLSRRTGLVWSWRATGWHWRDGNRWIPANGSGEPNGPFVELRDWIEPEPTR